MSESDIARQDLEHIRNIMSRTARFVSFSGYSALLIGGLWVVALIATGPELDARLAHAMPGTSSLFQDLWSSTLRLILLFVLSVLIGLGATYREARSKGEPVLNTAGLRIAFAMALHLAAGAALGLAASQYSIVFAGALVPVLYGFLLLNLARYSRHDVQPLGVATIAAGLWACYTGQVWLAYLLAFGVAHLIYGAWVEIAKRR